MKIILKTIVDTETGEVKSSSSNDIDNKMVEWGNLVDATGIQELKDKFEEVRLNNIPDIEPRKWYLRKADRERLIDILTLVDDDKETILHFGIKEDLLEADSSEISNVLAIILQPDEDSTLSYVLWNRIGPPTGTLPTIHP